MSQDSGKGQNQRRTRKVQGRPGDVATWGLRRSCMAIEFSSHVPGAPCYTCEVFVTRWCCGRELETAQQTALLEFQSLFFHMTLEKISVFSSAKSGT